MFKNTLKTAVLLGALGGLMVAIGSIWGTNGAIFGLIIAFVFVGGSYWFSDKLAIAAAGAVPVTEAELPQYYAIVRELTSAAGIPMPRLYISPDRQPNAFATGRNPSHAAVAVTAGILDALTWDELRAVLAHEISHVGNRDILISSVAAAVATAISFIARMAMFGAIFGGGNNDREGNNPIGLLATALLAPLAAGLLQMALSRNREFEADRSGAALIQDPEALARALIKIETNARVIPMNVSPAQAQKYIVNPLTGRKIQFANLFSTHPSTEDRVARLREMAMHGHAH
jgi:heat shock protein HtpX